MADSNEKSKGFELAVAQAALNRVKDQFTPEGCTLSIITEDSYPDIMDLMKNEYVPDEPICMAHDVEWNEAFEGLATIPLSQNISVMMTSNQDGRLMGIQVLEVINKGEKRYKASKIPNKSLREFIQFVVKKDVETNFFEKFKVDKMMHLLYLSVHRDFRRRGIGLKLFQAAEALAAELGFAAAKVEATSLYTIRIAEKEAFTILWEMPYKEYKLQNGRPMSEKTGPHRMFQIAGKSL